MRGGGGGLIETGSLINLETTMVSVLHKELEYKREKAKHESFRSCSWGSESNQTFHLVNKPSVHIKFYSRDWLINTVYYLLAKNN